MDEYGFTFEQAVRRDRVMGYESGNFQTMQEVGQRLQVEGGGDMLSGRVRAAGFNEVTAGMDPSSYEANEKR